MQNLREYFTSLFVSAGNSLTKPGLFFSRILTDLTQRVSAIAYKIIFKKNNEAPISIFAMLHRDRIRAKIWPFENPKFKQDKADFRQRILKNVLFALKHQNQQEEDQAFNESTQECATEIGERITTEQIEEFSAESSCQGRRGEMEDETLMVPELNLRINGQNQVCKLYCVFDGHGGAGCSRFAKDNLEKFLKGKIETLSGLNDEVIYLAFKDAMVELNEAFLKTGDMSGTTALCGLVIGKHVWVANVGDSRAILISSSGQVVQASHDAEPKEARFLKGITKKDGEVDDEGRIKGKIRASAECLRTGRALGDRNVGNFNSELDATYQKEYAEFTQQHQGQDWQICCTEFFKLKGYDLSQDVFKQVYSEQDLIEKLCYTSVVPNKPKITKYDLADFRGGHLVLACDGIWDVATSLQVGKFVHQQGQAGFDVGEISKQIVRTAYRAGSEDNLTALVVKL